MVPHPVLLIRIFPCAFLDGVEQFISNEFKYQYSNFKYIVIGLIIQHTYIYTYKFINGCRFNIFLYGPLVIVQEIQKNFYSKMRPIYMRTKEY